MKKLLLLLFVSASCANLFAGEGCSSCAEIIFRENKGQWEKSVLYKAEIKNGAIFFENDSITFNLFDVRDIIRIRGDHHKLEPYKPVIDYTMNYHAFRMKFRNASPQTASRGGDVIKEYFNYFIGNDKSKWAAKVKGFHEVNYSTLYPGINLKISSQESTLKYVYEVQPRADVNQLLVDFAGADIVLSEKGDLLIKTAVGDVMDMKPYSYQLVNEQQKEVPCEFVVKGNSVSYHFPRGYDNSKTLYIDPTLVFSTYSGSTADNFGYSATFDSKGNAFGAGSVFGVGYPLVIGHYIMSYQGGPTITFTTGGQYPGDDISITKYNATGTQRIFSTYLGGYGQDLPHSLIVNSKDELYVLGSTDCSNYPVTSQAFDTTFGGGPDPGVFDGIAAHYTHGSDIVISRLSLDGSQLLASTYVGGSGDDGLNYTAGQAYGTRGFLRHNYADEVRGEIEIDKNDNVFVASCTNSANFPRTAATFQAAPGGAMDACVFKMDANLSTMIWSTTFGGSGDDAAYSIAIDPNENLYVAGGTRSTNFPITNGVVQNVNHGGEADGFITHIDKNGQILIASTYYGFQDYDQCFFVETDKNNYVYVLGQADSSHNNYIKNALYNKPEGGQFITKFSHGLDSIIWSTSWGRGLGVTDISPTAFLVDVCNNIYACGWGSANINSYVGGTGSGTLGLDTAGGPYKGFTDGQDFYLMVMKDDASALSYATFMGGGLSEEHVDGGTSRFDRKGVVYESACAGCGAHSDFPTTPGVVSPTNHSNNCNNAVFKFDLNLPICLANFSAPTGCRNLPVTFNNLSTSVSVPTYTWYFGDGNTSSQVNPTHSYASAGLYNVTLIITDPGSCNGADTTSQKILILGGTGNDTLPTITICHAQSTQIGIPPNADTAITYQWSPAVNLSSDTVSNPIASPTQTSTYQLLVENGTCVDTFHQTVVLFTDALVLQGSNALCPGDTLQLSVTNSQPGQQLTYSWQPASGIISGANTANPLVSPSQTTTYTVNVTNQIGCTFSDSITISVLSSLPNVHATATPDTILFGDTSQLNLTLSGNVSFFQWQADSTISAINIDNPLAYPPNTHTYWVTVTDSQGCFKKDSVTVYVIHTPCSETNIYIPNAFSPNGDGKNDVLYVRANGITNLFFAVYDRWGQKVFETKDITKGWDGIYKGKKLDPAVFGYYAEGNCDTGEKFTRKGNVTILR